MISISPIICALLFQLSPPLSLETGSNSYLMDLELKSTDRRSQQPIAGANKNPETVVAIGDDDDDSNAKGADGNFDHQPSSFAIDIGEYERVCRICHLSAKESGKTPVDQLMEIGCGCKGELGVAHSDCAEAWFRVRGIRLCEICCETAKNITGVGDTSVFMEEWNENRSDDNNTLRRNGRCLSGQPLCNFLMACLVIAFVLPWFLRVNMF